MFGFKGFSLALAPEKGHYKIVRNDGSDAKETLSEGEYNFITFLYFYHKLNGSTEATGITREKIVVIDDPVSSLDSSVLLIISTLIRELINKCKESKGGILQLFVLTHIIYFHKEITFIPGRDQERPKENFYIIKKIDNISSFQLYKNNPITTTYELLWKEIRQPNPATFLNSMRRILEYYFNTIGGYDYEKMINKLTGEDLLIGKTLVSWINDGSHFISDDLFVQLDDANMNHYSIVFKKIFENLKHISHYNKMMGIG